MLVVSLINIIATVAVARHASATSAGMARDLRREVFTRVGGFSAQEVTRFGAPTLISRNTNDVQQVQLVVNMGLMFMVSIPIMMIGGIVMALREDVGLSWLVAVAVPLLGVIVGAIVVRMLPWFRRMQESVDTVNRILREQITGIRVVRAFVREDVEAERFDVANTTYTETAVAVGRLFSRVFPLVMFVFNAASVAVWWFGAQRVEAGAMEVGELTAFMQYLMQILMSVMFGTMMSMMIPRAAVSAGRITEVLDTASSVSETLDPRPLPDGPLTLAFDGVDFAYPGAEQPVLCALRFVAEPGRTTAIIGSTGSGKSTLVNLVPRLYDVTAGAVRLGGHDVRQVALADLWSGRCRGALRPRSARAGRMCPAVSGSGWPSPAHSCDARRSISSTTPSRRSTSQPTPDCGRPWGRSPATPRSSSSPNASRRSSTRIRSSSWRTAGWWGPAGIRTCWRTARPTRRSWHRRH